MRTGPPIGLYGVCNWKANPFLLADGSIDPEAVRNHARFGTIILEATPLLHRPDIVAELRKANPALRILGFMDLEKAYFAPAHSLDPATDFTGQLYQAAASVAGDRGFLWSAKYGDRFDPEKLPPQWPRPIAPEASWSAYGRNLASTECVESTARVVIDRVVGSGLFDGVFCDLAQQYPGWTSSAGGDVIDFARAGFSSLPAWVVAYAENHRLFFRRVTEAAPDGFAVEFNCATSDPIESAYAWGQMDENFPTNPGGQHDALGVMLGIWARERRRPTARSENWINQQPDAGGLDWSVSANLEAIAFGVACAWMTDTARFTMSMNGRPNPDGRERRWCSLYDLDLGAALGPPARVAGTMYVRAFQHGVVTVDLVLRRGRFYDPRVLQA